MKYRGPDFLAIEWFGSSLTPSIVSKLDRRRTERQFAEGRGVGAKSYDGKKAWSAMYNPTLSVTNVYSNSPNQSPKFVLYNTILLTQKMFCFQTILVERPGGALVS
jgi:hypothetical protein